ncbi:hypothetical protein AAK943_20285, partial [Emergencia timonensis]|uniref:hypothetical protein n=1 Tax=Emergencia timonensis TaxID=1776384 RepID=UPI0035173B0B
AKRLRMRTGQSGICITEAGQQRGSYAELGESGKTVTQASRAERHLHNGGRAAEGQLRRIGRIRQNGYACEQGRAAFA